ncbi:hypothetical protein C8A00DRAFT_37689 [Chaetomidium leptoderma]|uniref:Uncharacterized protein n=1 Tax=Chaetomidium leptoderma TaxID=669021 RepID=A0AAN6VGF2_9PEZI|nr:hypothetical protein C8A00DRAFT_37689 [Chaetomidium leptoderma]
MQSWFGNGSGVGQPNHRAHPLPQGANKEMDRSPSLEHITLADRTGNASGTATHGGPSQSIRSDTMGRQEPVASTSRPPNTERPVTPQPTEFGAWGTATMQSSAYSDMMASADTAQSRFATANSVVSNKRRHVHSGRHVTQYGSPSKRARTDSNSLLATPLQHNQSFATKPRPPIFRFGKVFRAGPSANDKDMLWEYVHHEAQTHSPERWPLLDGQSIDVNRLWQWIYYGENGRKPLSADQEEGRDHFWASVRGAEGIEERRFIDGRSAFRVFISEVVERFMTDKSVCIHFQSDKLVKEDTGEQAASQQESEMVSEQAFEMVSEQAFEMASEQESEMAPQLESEMAPQQEHEVGSQLELTPPPEHEATSPSPPSIVDLTWDTDEGDATDGGDGPDENATDGGDDADEWENVISHVDTATMDGTLADWEDACRFFAHDSSQREAGQGITLIP